MNKITHIESLRGVLAIFIVLFHYPIDSLITGEFLINAWIAVDIFFVISGYVITLNYLGIKSIDQVASFQRRRFWRIYPLHFVTLIIFLILEIVKSMPYFIGFAGTYSSFVINDLSSLISHLFLAQVLTGDAFSWNIVSWSISAEFWTYIIFAFAAFFSAKDIKKYLFVSSLLIAISAITLSIYGFLPINGLARAVYSFFIGSCFFILFEGKFKNVSTLITFSLILGLFSIAFFSYGEDSAGINFFIPLFAAPLLLALNGSNQNNMLMKFLNLPPLIYLGKISFSIYLLHNIIWGMLKLFLTQGLDLPLIVNTQNETRILIESSFLSNLLILCSLSILIFISHFSYKYI
jgi:peptidoglycan/LPS O-acetylase OafA/YrhL